MNYKLQFIKISPNHQIAGVGFGGNMFIVLNALTTIGETDRMYVDMETYDCICTEKDVVLHDTMNSWEYYFDQMKLKEGEPFNEMNSLVRGNLHYDNKGMFTNPNNFIPLKEKFYNNFQLKPYLKELIDTYYENNIKGKITLGVQVRLTDMKHHHNVSPIEKYIKRIEKTLIENPKIEQIFLATDDWVTVNQLRSSINVPVICHEDMFRADSNNRHTDPHDRLYNDRELHRYKIGIECIQEIFTLTKCDYFLKADVSSISICTIILSENIKQIYYE